MLKKKEKHIKLAITRNQVCFQISGMSFNFFVFEFRTLCELFSTFQLRKETVEKYFAQFKDSVLNITKLIKWQIKLVDTILQRDKNSYKKNNLKLKSISDSDWVYGYIIRLSHAYMMQTKKLKRNSRAIMIVARDVLYSLGINQEIKYGELVADYYVKKKFEEKGTDYFRGGEIGESDYNNFLKISDKKDKVNKILPCMELTQYLCSQLGMPPIHETKLNKQKEN